MPISSIMKAMIEPPITQTPRFGFLGYTSSPAVKLSKGARRANIQPSAIVRFEDVLFFDMMLLCHFT